MDSCGVLDVGFCGPNYTWCNKHFDHDLIWEMLDRFFINPDMQSRCGSFKVLHLAFLASDHRPLLAEWKEEPPDQMQTVLNRPSKFEEIWTKYDECKDIVKQVWQEHGRRSSRNLTEKTKECLTRLGWWSRSHYDGSIKGAIARKEKEIQIP